MSFDPETTLMTAERRREYSLMRLAEIELERVKLDQELRRWCIEQIKGDLGASGIVAEADKIYDWVRNKPKADAA